MGKFLFVTRTLALASTLVVSGCFENDASTDEETEEVAAYRAEKAERDEIRKRLSELRSEKKELEAELKILQKELAGKPGVVEKELEVAGQLETARGYVSSLTALEKELDAALQIWRPATRNSFKGVTLQEIITTDGTRYTGVAIKEVGDETLTILHSGGEVTVPILQLPVGLRRNLIHEPTVLADQSVPAN